MSLTSRQRFHKQPSPESGRPRLRGKTAKPSKLDVTKFQQELHGMSSKQSARSKTRGAFGGCTRDQRILKRIKRRFVQ